LSNIPLLSIEETLERMSGDRELLANLFQFYIDDAPKKLTISMSSQARATFTRSSATPTP
jgi:hypothetical protein